MEGVVREIEKRLFLEKEGLLKGKEKMKPYKRESGNRSKERR